MRIRVHVSHKDGGEPWTEEYDLEDSVDPEEWARETVERFNETLRPHEKLRKVLRVEKLGASLHKNHVWTKVSVMGQSGPGGRIFDRMKCETCSVTGKRYGLGSSVKRDSEFRQPAFEYCDTAIALFEKRRKKDHA